MTDIEISRLDDCCYRVDIREESGEEEVGVWCPKTKILAIDGKIAGIFESQDDIKERLTPVQTTVYRDAQV